MLTRILVILTLILSSVAYGKNESLIITIEKTVSPYMIQRAVKDLEVHDYSYGQCYFYSKVESYIDSSNDSQASYWGTAIVELEYECADERRNQYIRSLLQDRRFKLWSNPNIGGFPSVSGG